MRKHLPWLALIVAYVVVNLTWQYRMTREIERLRQEAVTHEQQRAWVEHLARMNETTLDVPEFN